MNVAVFHNLMSGGAKRSLHDLVRYLVESGHTVDAFLPSTADETFLPLREVVRAVHTEPVRMTPLGVVISTIRYLPPLTCSRADLEAAQRRLAARINRGPYDVALVEQDYFTMSPFILRYLTKPSVYACQQPGRLDEVAVKRLHDRAAGARRGDGPARRLVAWYYRRGFQRIDRRNAAFASYVLANSYFSREAILRAYGLDAAVCHLGIDTRVFRPLGGPVEGFVLSVGSCTPSKGFDFLVTALARIPEPARPRLCVVANVVDPAWRQYLEGMAARHRVAMEIRVLVSQEELVTVYNRAALFLYAPYLEPFGLAPLEAMACGTPVVAVREGGVRETVADGEVGLLVDRDPVAFASAVAGLLSDVERRTALAARATAVAADRWRIARAGECLVRHLARAIEAWPGGAGPAAAPGT